MSNTDTRESDMSTKSYKTKAEAVQVARQMREQGHAVKVYREVRNIPGSGHNRPYQAVRFYVKAAA